MDPDFIRLLAIAFLVILLVANLWRVSWQWYRRTRYCGLTCRGGSESKRCPCDGPLDCRVPETRDRYVADMIRRNSRERSRGSSNPGS